MILPEQQRFSANNELSRLRKSQKQYNDHTFWFATRINCKWTCNYAKIDFKMLFFGHGKKEEKKY